MTDTWTVLSLSKDNLELRILPGIGGRLWDISFCGQSLLFQNPDLLDQPVDLDDLERLLTRSPQFNFPLWGGEKTWIAPESDWLSGNPYPVLDSGPYTVQSRTPDQVDMKSAVCPITQLSIRRSIRLVSGSHWSIEHGVTNHGPTQRYAGIWSVMMIEHPSTIGVPMDSPEIHHVFGETEPPATKHENGVVTRCAKPQEFKIGLPNPTGRTFIRFGNGGPWLICETPLPTQDDIFAHEQPFEVFNSADYAYCEAEWHAPARMLSPGDTLSFLQSFHVWSGEDVQQHVGLTPSDKHLLSSMS